MTDPIQLLTVAQAAALAASTPDYTDSDGAIRRAEAVEIVRRGDAWVVQIPRTRSFTLPTGKIVREGLASFTDSVKSVATAEVTIGGFRIPVLLAHAILGAYYVAREAGEIVPAPPSAIIPLESTP